MIDIEQVVGQGPSILLSGWRVSFSLFLQEACFDRGQVVGRTRVVSFVKRVAWVIFHIGGRTTLQFSKGSGVGHSY